jgi:hypothetical protein
LNGDDEGDLKGDDDLDEEEDDVVMSESLVPFVAVAKRSDDVSSNYFFFN